MPSEGVHGRGALTALIALVSLTALFAAASAQAAPGELDPSFSGDGRATVNFGSDDAHDYTDVAVTPTGNIVLAGTTDAVVNINDHNRAFALAQLRPDGTLDPSFGGGDGLAIKEL